MEKQGQIAHVDRNRANSTFDNLAWLCLPHHDRYDSRTSQSKGFTPQELRKYRGKLYERVETGRPLTALAMPTLRVRVDPTRSNSRLMAYFRVENTTERSVRVDGWLYEWRDGDERGLSECSHKTLPIVLGERQEHAFFVELGDIDPSVITRLAIMDSDRRCWEAAASDLARFAALAETEKHYAHLGPSDAALPEQFLTKPWVDVRFEARSTPGQKSLCFVATVTNIGTDPVPILQAGLEWSFKKARGTVSIGGPSAQQIGGAINIPSSIREHPLRPGASIEIVIDDEWTPILIDAAADDVDRSTLAFVLIVSKKVGWRCTEDGLPEAVERVARSVLANRRT